MLERAKCLLSGQMLENISLLKMIEAYGEYIGCSVIEQGQEWGVLLRLPTRHSPYDRVQYGDTEEIVFVAGNASACIGKLLDELAIHRPLLFKLQRVEYRRQIEQKFHLQKMRSFHTYSCTQPVIDSKLEDGVVEGGFQPQLAALWTLNGYEEEELRRMFQCGATSYSLYVNGAPASTCIVFRNYGNVWEVGAVYTVDAHRGKGYAKKVTATAINRLLRTNAIPRY